MPAPLISPKARFFDANGLPLAGGKLYAYAIGSSTPQDTYTDYTLATPNANPVVLDANGEASIWLGTKSYKFVLKNAADVTQWTIDGVSEAGVAGFASSAQLVVTSPVNAVDQTAVILGLAAQSPTKTCDPGSEFSTSTGRFTVLNAGTYMIVASSDVYQNGATMRTGGYPIIEVCKNGNPLVRGTAPAWNAAASPAASMTAHGIFQCNAGDYLTAQVTIGFSAGGPPNFYYDLSIYRLY